MISAAGNGFTASACLRKTENDDGFRFSIVRVSYCYGVWKRIVNARESSASAVQKLSTSERRFRFFVGKMFFNGFANKNHQHFHGDTIAVFIVLCLWRENRLDTTIVSKIKLL